MKAIGLAVVTLLTVIYIVFSPSVAAIDVEFRRAWESAQAARPRQVPSVGRIAAATESGQPLTIRGRVMDERGTPVPAAVVFAWQTDASGHYDHRGARPHSWRLRGWAQTDAQGRFTFHTIRPAPYPNHREAAHVHFSVETKKGPRYFADDLRFADDPLLGGREGASVTERNGRQHVDVTLRLEKTRRF